MENSLRLQPCTGQTDAVRHHDCITSSEGPGPRILKAIGAHRWRRNWPDITFTRAKGSSKGTLVGRKAGGNNSSVPLNPSFANDNGRISLRRVAGLAALFASGWFANGLVGDFSTPASAASFVNEAQEAYNASQVRWKMASQVESIELNRREILDATGIDFPALPSGWSVLDAQLYPSDLGNSVMVSVKIPSGETISIFAAQAETSFGALPMMTADNGVSVAYWEEGPLAMGLVGELDSSRLLELAAALARIK